jgi:hypothetical protein
MFEGDPVDQTSELKTKWYKVQTIITPKPGHTSGQAHERYPSMIKYEICATVLHTKARVLTWEDTKDATNGTTRMK